ncbi:MAG: MFS transporter [Candidatus Hodarchaeales archaeon]|jgi:UMF1 family MFS transporter
MAAIVIKTSKMNVMLWTTYDIANTIFSMGIVSMTVLQYGTLLGMLNGFDYGFSYFIANILVALSTLIVAITIPVMGTISDNNGKGKPGTILFGSLTILLTGFVFLFENFFLAMFLFIGANIFYQWGNLFYDTMIPRISQKNDIGWVSAVGIALGYFGSFFAVIFNLVAIALFNDSVYELIPDNIGTISPNNYEAALGVPKSEWIGHLGPMWVICAAGFFLMALPFLLTREVAGRNRLKEEGLSKLFKLAITETIETGKEIWRYKDMRWFVIGWFFTVDVVQTVIYIMKTAAIDGFGMGESQATILLLVGVVFAVILTGFAGPIADRKGSKFLASLVSFIWIIALAIPLFADSFDSSVEFPVFLSFLPNFTIFFMAILIGFGMGSIWVVQRTMTIELAPEGKVGKYFGFSKLAGKGSSAFGIILFGGVISIFSSTVGSLALAYKIGIGVLLVLFIIGTSFFMRVKNHHEEYLAGRRAPFE